MSKTMGQNDSIGIGQGTGADAAREEKTRAEDYEARIARLNEQLTAARSQIEAQERRLRRSSAQIRELRRQLAEVQNAYNVISNAAAWKLTKPLRATLDAMKRVPAIRLSLKGVKSLKDNGVRDTLRKVKNRETRREQAVQLSKQPLFTQEELERQRAEVFPRKLKFSIVVPLYNTPEKLLRAMIESVQAQTYADWELCMADGSDAAHGDVERICKGYAERDARVVYKKLEKNLGISGNTNACLDMARGDYIGLFDHDDMLHPAALYEVMKAICDKDADFIYTDENTFRNTPEDAYQPNFKPAFAPDTLRGNNYICHFSVFKRSLLEKTGGFDAACDGSQDHDMILRLTEQAQRVVHIPEILYFWRCNPGSVAEDVSNKPYVFQAGIRAVEKQLERLGLEGEAETVAPNLPFYHIRYKIHGQPKISVLIPNYNHLSDLKTCVDSILDLTTWPNYEIVIVENNSTDEALFAYYEQVQELHDEVRVVTWKDGAFNYSALNNFGARFCDGDYLLLLNNDTEVITPDWMQEMLMFAQRPDVGAVGAKLYYPDDTIQHGGVILGIGGVGGHSHKYFSGSYEGYMGRLLYAQNLSAVTAACMMLRRDVWDEVQGLDESYAVAFNDVDLCMRIREAGYLIVWTPFAELYHHESKSRGMEDTLKKKKRFEGEVNRFMERWSKALEAGDPYYNPNLTLTREDFSFQPVVRQHPAR